MKTTQTQDLHFRIILWLLYLLANLMLLLTMPQDEHRLFCSGCLLAFSGIVTLAVFNRHVSLKLLSYIFMACVMANNVIDSVLHQNIHYVIIVLFGCCTLFSIFKDELLVLVHGAASLALVLYHIAVTGYIDISVPRELRIAVLSCLGIVGISGYLCGHIRVQKKKEEELKQLAESAMDAERSKSDFLANMSHEIRTPMNAIVGMCEMILREGDISSTVREYCFNIQNSGRSLLSIINDILDFSKIESGKMEFIEDEFNPASTLNDVINMSLARLGDKKLEIVVNVDPDLPKGLLGDEIRIRQILINLMTNAIKYTRQGVVSLKITQTRHDYGINLTIRVKDSGIGITPENLEKLFTSFQQVDTKKNRSVEGTGLGLAISKRLITQMGGFISVSSEYGKGSEFKVVLPLKVSDPSPFIMVKSKKPIFAASYVDLSKFQDKNVVEAYGQLISEIGNQLHISLTAYQTFDRLKARIDRGGLTHCFIGRSEYLSQKEYFEKLAEQMDVILIQDRINAVHVPLRIKCVYKPFYALPIAAILNNESIIENLGEAKGRSVNFTAPEARILVVDDNVINLQVAEGLMRPYHMQVITAESGSEAIRLLHSKDIHLIFMDHMMPEMDGVETTQKIRQMEGEYYHSVPIIALTANAVGGVKKMFLESGFQDFMPKPIELSTLDKMLKTWLPDSLQKKMTAMEESPAEQPPDIPLEEDDCLKGLIDTKLGLFYTGGNTQAYLSILSSYLDKGTEKLEKIRGLWAQQEWKNYVIEVHALKSSSLSIGAKQLSELAKELEAAGKGENYRTIEEKTEALLELYDKVINAGKTYLEHTNAKPDPGQAPGSGQHNDIAAWGTEGTQDALAEIDTAQLAQIIECLKEAGDAFDSEAMEAACEEASAYRCRGRELKPYFDKVRQCIEDFEYEEACRIAASILQQWEEGQ